MFQDKYVFADTDDIVICLKSEVNAEFHLKSREIYDDEDIEEDKDAD